MKIGAHLGPNDRTGIVNLDEFLQWVDQQDEAMAEEVATLHRSMAVDGLDGVSKRLPANRTGETRASLAFTIGEPTMVEGQGQSPAATMAANKATALAIKGFVNSAIELNKPWSAKLEFGNDHDGPNLMFFRTQQELSRKYGGK